MGPSGTESISPTPAAAAGPRSWSAAIATLALALLVGGPGEAHADWLRVLPSCAQTPYRDGHAHLHYPRPGLPALAHPGEELRLRVELPLALTPAPGIQQPRALQGWQALLTGRSPIAEGNAGIRFAPRIRGIYPIDRHTGIYEVVVGLSPAMPPGTYDVRITPPWVSPAFTEASLRIVDGPVHLAQWIPREDVPFEAAFDHGEVDAWVAESAPPGPGPWLALDTKGAIFELEGQALVLGGCDDVHRDFQSLRNEVSLETFAGPWPPAPAAPPILVSQNGAMRNQGPAAALFPYPFAEDGRPRPHPAAEGYYPGTAVRPEAQRATLAALIRLNPGEAFVPPRAGASSNASAALHAERISARRFRLQAETSGLHAPVRIAYFWEEDPVRWVPEDQSVDLEATSIGTLETHALLIDAQGQSLRVAQGLPIRTESPQSCSSAPDAASLWWALLGTILVARYKRRRPNFWVF